MVLGVSKNGSTSFKYSFGRMLSTDDIREHLEEYLNSEVIILTAFSGRMER
jgi:hypothetical protein